MRKTNNRKWLALFTALIILVSCSFAVLAAPSAKVMKIRLSTGYGYAGSDIRITPWSFSSNGASGYITVLSDVTWYAPYKNGNLVGLDAGTQFSYSIASLKEGGTITLKYIEGTGSAMTSAVMSINQGGYPNLKTLTGKIHINGTNSFGHIWKIDGFTKNGQKLGIYFRDT